MSNKQGIHGTLTRQFTREVLLVVALFAVSPAPSFAEATPPAAQLPSPPSSPKTTTDTQALREEALAYEHGQGVAKNPQKAFALYCQAAKAGDLEAMYSLGWMAMNGRGMPHDDSLAAYFFNMAASKGHGPSQKALSLVGTPTTEIPRCLQEESIAGFAPIDFMTNEKQRRLAELINRLAPEYGVMPRLAFAVAHTESRLNPQAVSPKNAQGLMQLIPETSARFNVRNPFDPEQNIRGGLAYLRWLLAYFKGNVPLVVAAYNAGEGAVNRYLGIPPYAETRDYVQRILAVFPQREHPFNPAITEPSPSLPLIDRRMARSKP